MATRGACEESVTERLEVLAHADRRRILTALSTGSPESVSSLEIEELKRQNGGLSRAELYHQHLPKLEDGGFVMWDQDAGRVERGPSFSSIEPLLEFVVAEG